MRDARVSGRQGAVSRCLFPSSVPSSSCTSRHHTLLRIILLTHPPSRLNIRSSHLYIGIHVTFIPLSIPYAHLQFRGSPQLSH
ncbi:hypothetical protein FIBSPDRAFT_304798 [Athelia psychrophila]|uniref:Uncharacterized protein n=1 Tax=Athelia psychrophila TaxID=1759441 RepID=A0A167X0M6_9AGAM|nr:hypothetical protein FIBSPDRAFT_304798 [Fibularhizoctonia sp. CBS 109695]